MARCVVGLMVLIASVPGSLLTVAGVDGPRLSPWIETGAGGRVRPWEAEIALP
jgi:hypothetical protein